MRGDVEHVETPLMMIHGDLDFLPISQAEQFFTALYRQNKRARLVRYWGEGHELAGSPANLSDLWRRIFAWFDELLDLTRDREGHLIFEGDHAQSRNGGPPLTPEDFAQFDHQGMSESALAP